MKLKDRIRNFFRRSLTPKIGLFACTTYVILSLISIVLLIVYINMSGYSLAEMGFGTILAYYIVNIVFYLIVANYFRKAPDNYWYCFIAMIVLTVSTYVIPLIFDLINRIVYGLSGLGGTRVILSLISIIASAALGILYLIFMILENNTKKRAYNIALFVIGIIMTVFALYTFIVDVYALSISISTSVVGIFSYIVNIVSEVVLFCFSLLYLTYAYDVYRIRTGSIYD